MKIEITIEEIQYLQSEGIMPDVAHLSNLQGLLRQANEEVKELRAKLELPATHEPNALKRCQDQLTLASKRADEAEAKIVQRDEIIGRLQDGTSELREKLAAAKDNFERVCACSNGLQVATSEARMDAAAWRTEVEASRGVILRLEADLAVVRGQLEQRDSQWDANLARQDMLAGIP